MSADELLELRFLRSITSYNPIGCPTLTLRLAECPGHQPDDGSGTGLEAVPQELPKNGTTKKMNDENFLLFSGKSTELTRINELGRD